VNTAVNTAWTYLVAAGLFEIGWPLGLKWAQQAERTPALVTGIVVAVVAMGISGVLLYLAQKEICRHLAVSHHGTYLVPPTD
jgi:multidrug transporter EmrE-like cation transporter